MKPLPLLALLALSFATYGTTPGSNLIPAVVVESMKRSSDAPAGFDRADDHCHKSTVPATVAMVWSTWHI